MREVEEVSLRALKVCPLPSFRKPRVPEAEVACFQSAGASVAATPSSTKAAVVDVDATWGIGTLGEKSFRQSSREQGKTRIPPQNRTSSNWNCR